MAKMSLIVAVLLSATVPTASADIYKCVANGKVTYTDTPCNLDANPVKLNQNTYSNGGVTYQSGSSRRGSSSSRCAELMSEMGSTVPDASSQSVGEMMATKQRRNALREQYEMQCMSSSERGAASQGRMEEKLDNIRSRQIQMDNRQREMQDKQRQMDFERRQNRTLNGY